MVSGVGCKVAGFLFAVLVRLMMMIRESRREGV